MKIDRVKNTKRNIVAAVINKLLSMIMPFLNRTLFVYLLGPEYLGLSGLFASLLGVLAIAELGFGNAVVYSMYKPIADDDHDKLCALLNFYRKIYLGVGCTILTLGLCCMPFLRKFVSGEIPPDVNLYILFVIHLFNVCLGYFLYGYKQSLLAAFQRDDIGSHIRTIVQMLQYALTFVMLVVFRNYYACVLVETLGVITTNFMTAYMVNRTFPQYTCHGKLGQEEKQLILTKVKAIFMHRVGGVIVNSLDNIVISAFMGLVLVAKYGNYYHIYTCLSGFIYQIYTSMTGGLGNSIATETVEQNYQRFMKLTFLNIIIVSWCSICLIGCYQPFMHVWLGEEMMLPLHTMMLIVVYFYVQHARQILLTMKTAAGIWEQDRYKPLIGGLVNVVLNIILIQIIGLDGVILSTIIQLVFIDTPWETIVLFKYYFKRSVKEYFAIQLGFFALCAIYCGAVWLAIEQIPLSGLAGLLVKGIATGVAATGLIVVTFRQKLSTLKGYLKRRR